MPRLNVRNEVFDVMYDYKHEGLDIGDAYDEIFDLIVNSYVGKRSGRAKTGTRRTYPKKRKLNSWQKFVKANSSKRKYKKMNNTRRLKSLGIAYRKTAAYKRNKKK